MNQTEMTETIRQTTTVNLPQLSLIVFSGNSQEWREFWSNFEAVVHKQDFPNIQKLNYSLSCLKEEASRAVFGYDIASENYSIISNY